jgi:hypothetical protein
MYEDVKPSLENLGVFAAKCAFIVTQKIMPMYFLDNPPKKEN